MVVGVVVNRCLVRCLALIFIELILDGLPFFSPGPEFDQSNFEQKIVVDHVVHLVNVIFPKNLVIGVKDGIKFRGIGRLRDNGVEDGDMFLLQRREREGGGCR